MAEVSRSTINHIYKTAKTICEEKGDKNCPTKRDVEIVIEAMITLKEALDILDDRAKAVRK